jgi:quercetin dioxygenase-like cupin family protein
LPRKNGDSSAFSLSSSDPAPGRAIDTHRHPGADEILFLHTGIARVHMRDSVRVVHAGATEFIPANTWISVDNIENDVIYLVGILSGL